MLKPNNWNTTVPHVNCFGSLIPKLSSTKQLFMQTYSGTAKRKTDRQTEGERGKRAREREKGRGLENQCRVYRTHLMP